MLCVGTFTAPEGATITVRDKRTDQLADLFDLDNDPISNPIVATHSGTQSAVRIHPSGIYHVSIKSKSGEFLTSYDIFAVEDTESPSYVTLQDFQTFQTLTEQTLPIAQGGTGATSAAAAWASLIADAGSANVIEDLYGTPMPEHNLIDCNAAIQRGYHKALVSPLNAPYENFGACLLRTVIINRSSINNLQAYSFSQDISQGVKSVSGRIGITGRWWRGGSAVEGGSRVLFGNWELG